MSAHRPAVLILSNDPTFARELAAQWPKDPNAPEFTVLEGSLFRDLIGCHYDLAIADASLPKADSDLKQALFSAAKPAILIHAGPRSVIARTSSHSEGPVIELYRGEPRKEPESESETPPNEPQSWAAITGLLGREILRRARADVRAREAEAESANAQTEATLGRFMVEMRHNLNNALTSVLGNAELLTLEPGLPAKAIAQADTIRNMALRMHEIFQRFSSIEKELSVVARECDKEVAKARAAGAH